MTRILSKVAFSIIGIALVLFLLELFSGFINPLITTAHNPISFGVGGREVLEYPSGYIKDRELFWTLEPSFEEYNSAGFRDKEFSFDKGNNIFRIICLGDSVTFGWPAKKENTYPKILEKILNTRFTGRKFEVMNAGVPGYTSFQGKLLLESKLVRYRPDLIIVYYGINDVAGSYKPDKDQPKLPSWAVKSANCLRRLQLYKLFLKLALNLKYPLGMSVVYPGHRVSPEDYQDNIRSIKKTADECGIRTLFIIRSVFYDPKKKVVFTDANYIPPEDVPQVDIYDIFKRKKKDAGALFLDDNRPFNFHFTDEGQRILSESIFEVLIKRKIIS